LGIAGPIKPIYLEIEKDGKLKKPTIHEKYSAKTRIVDEWFFTYALKTLI